MESEWDPAKNLSNQRKHGMHFEDASLVFDDPFHISREDRVVDGEVRWQTFGIVGGQVLLVVAHTFTDADSIHTIVRIISARRAERLGEANL